MDNTVQPNLPKWPFCLGDGVLLITALAIALRADDPLDTAIVAWYVLLVALGACLFTFPYVMEYLAGLRLANNQLKESVGDLVDGMRETSEETGRHERVLADLAQKNATSVSRIDTLIGEMDERISGVETSFEVVLNERNALFESTLSEKLGEQLKPLQALLKRFQRLQDTLLEEIGKLETLEGRMEGLSDSLAERIALLDGSEVIVMDTASDDMETGTDPVDEKGVETAADPDVAKKKSVAGSKKKRTARKKASSPSDEDAVPRPIEEEPLLFQEDDVEGAIVRTPSENPNSISLVVNSHVGIGNKPYVRVEGEGLDPEKGVPMDFVEIGKWEWMPEDVSCAVIARIFLNDSQPALGEGIKIAVGERVECTARFAEQTPEG